MVVPASDSLTVDDGFAFDASDAIPGFDDEAIPMDEDIAASPDASDEDGAASPEPEPFSVESLALTPEQVTALESHYRDRLSPELQTAFDNERSEWDRVRISLEGAAESHKAERLKAAAWYSASQDVIGQLLQEIGADQTQIDAIRYRVQSMAGQRLQAHAQKLQQAHQQTQQVQQAQTDDEAWFTSEIDSVRSLMHAHAQSLGLDPKHEGINKEFENLVVKAARVYANNPHDKWAKEAFDAAKAAHKERVTSMGNQIKRRKAAKPSSDAVDRQRGRGVQNLGRGAGGAGAVSPTDVVSKAWEMFPDNERARTDYVTQQLQPQR